MNRLSVLGRHVRGGSQFRVVNVIVRDQKRYNTPYMPFPFDKYKRPGSAKYWLSKYPPADQSQDQFEPELLYLDELDERIRQAAKHYAPSEKWKNAYNEYGWYDDVHVTEFYGSIGGDSSQELVQKYGRGRKIDPSHYINPKYSIISRAPLPSQYVHPDLRKRLGPLQNLLALPPEEPSVFKLWNPFTLLAGVGAIAFSKEWFLVSHDFWHAMTFWMAWSIIISVAVDWWTWWQVLRGQEWYDHDYFPLNEKVDKLFKELNKLENKPVIAKHTALMIPYMQAIAARVIEKRRNDDIVHANNETLDKLESKLKEENSTRTGVANSFKENAFQQAVAKLEVASEKKAYMNAALKALKGNAEFKTGQAVKTSGLTIFKDSYTTFLSNAEQKYLEEQRSKGTLPWVFATADELSSKQPTQAQIKERYNTHIKEFEKKYHKVAQLSL